MTWADDLAAGLQQYSGQSWGAFTIDKISYADGLITYSYTLSGERHVETEPWQGDMRALAGRIDWWLGLEVAHLDERGLL